MKRTMVLLLAALMLVCLTACTAKTSEPHTGTQTETVVEATQEVVKEDNVSSGSSSSTTTTSSASKSDIEAALQGTWLLGGENSFVFDNGKITISGGGNRLEGTYSVNTTDSVIEATLSASDGNLQIKLPYTYSNGTLTVKNNNGQALVKQ